MKTFTVRDMDRTPSAVLDACDREGSIKVRRRDGRTYTVTTDAPPKKKFKAPDLRARWAKFCPEPIPKEQVELVNRLIAGE